MLQWQAFCQISETSNSSATLELRACGFVGTSEDYCHLDEFNVWWLGKWPVIHHLLPLEKAPRKILLQFAFDLGLNYGRTLGHDALEPCFSNFSV